MGMASVQSKFTDDIADLIRYAHDELGYKLTFGDAFRDPRVHGQQGEKGEYGQAWSAHKQRLAVDFNLFIDGQYQSATEAFRELGEFWETLDEENVWGGRFDDGNHFSRRYNGIA